MQAQSIHQLGEQIGTRMAAAELAGSEGRVDESLVLMDEVEELKKKKSAAEVISECTVRFLCAQGRYSNARAKSIPLFVPDFEDVYLLT